jgi:FAD synthetase
MQLVLTFGTFDYLHPGHKFYLRQAKKQGDYLVTIIARDKNVYEQKGDVPDHDEEERMNIVRESHIPDLVALWDEHDRYKVLSEYQPAVICLGYDQKADETKILAYCKEHGFVPSIKRIESYKPELHKSSLKKKQWWRYDTPRYI